MVGWHHRLDGHEFEQALGVGEGQESLACCSPRGHKESDTTERLDWTGRDTAHLFPPRSLQLLPRWPPLCPCEASSIQLPFLLQLSR